VKRLAAALTVLLALPGAAKDPLAGRTAGTPTRCVSDNLFSGPTIADNNTIIYNRPGRRLWVTHPVGQCPSLRPQNTLVVEKWGSETCANDRFRVLEPGTTIPSAFCRFGTFTPYDLPAKAPRN
jgi:hypothetical protein